MSPDILETLQVTNPVLQVATSLFGNSSEAATMAWVEDAACVGMVDGTPWSPNVTSLVLVGRDSTVRVSLTAPDVIVGRPVESVDGGSMVSISLKPGTGEPVEGAPARDEVEMRFNHTRARQIHADAKAAYEVTRQHVQTREQFGRPLVKIPAVAANLAHIKVQLLLIEAVLKRLEACPDDRTTALIASGTAVESGTEVARLAHQLLGARGIRDDHELTRLSRRIWAFRDALISPADQEEKLGDLVIGLGEDPTWNTITGI